MAKIKAVHSSSAPEHPLNPVNNFFNSALDKAKDDNINVLALENKPELNKLEGANGQNDSLWGTLVTDGPKREELTKPLNNSETLQNHWRQWGLDNTGGFSTDLHEADSLSSAAKDVMDYAKAHPELVRAWDTNGDGKVTYDELKSFVVNTKSDIKSVAQAYKKYRENNPHANRTSDQMVRDAALVAANIHLIGGGVSDHLIEGQKGNEGEYVNKWQLYYFAQSNSQFSQDLKNAANLVSHEGMSRIFDAHGDNPATAKSDYLFDAENITKWIASDAAPDTSVDFMTLMENVANADIIADVDLSEIGPEVFKGDLDAKTTAAVLAKLVDMRLKLKAGDASNLWDPYGKDGLNGNINTVKRDLDKKIEILSNDQETLEYLRANAPKSLQSLINADPQLKAQLQHHYDYELSQGYYDYDYSNSGAFNDIFYRRDENGKILSTPDAVREFVADANEIRQALGLPLGSLKDIAMKSGHYDDVVAYYETHLKDAQDLQGYLNEGMDANEAAKVYYRDLNAFSRVLGMSDGELSVAGGKAQDLLIDKKASETTTTAFYNQFEDGNGNLDEGKLGTFLEGLKDTNPEMFTDALGEQISPDTIIRGIRAVWDTIRHGETTLLALEDLKASLGKDSIDRGEHITVMHKQGIMHAGTALLLGTAVGVAAAGKPETAPELLSVIGGGVSTVSFSLIAGGKYSKFSHTEIARNIEDKAKYNTEIEKKIDGENKKLKTLEEHKVDREEIIAANQRRLEKGKFKKDDYYEFFLERQIENEKSEIKK
ncbi:type III effector HrpK domain-containing protein, partial [Rhodomicrobium sp. R_RK_3]|uniref:type III effector HrpK domain-containing protein n=1 Tax=Rhodomicrobium sp. R_RK_3 TaxID=2029567 RepID=UPI001AECD4B0